MATALYDQAVFRHNLSTILKNVTQVRDHLQNPDEPTTALQRWFYEQEFIPLAKTFALGSSHSHKFTLTQGEPLRAAFPDLAGKLDEMAEIEEQFKALFPSWLTVEVGHAAVGDKIFYVSVKLSWE